MLLLSTTTLPCGLRVRLRVPRSADRQGLEELALRVGVELDELTLCPLLRTDPRRGRAACATTWLGTREVLVGAAVIDNAVPAPAQIVVADEALAPGVGRLLAEALDEWARNRAA